jgi:hypothetical protein
MTRALLLSFLAIAILTSAAFAQDKTDEQFQALAAARTKAEVAVRKLRTFYEENENRWRALQQAPDASIRNIYEAIRKAAEDEQRKAEDLRNQAVIDELNQRRGLIEGDWNRFANTDRPSLDLVYRQSQQNMERIWQSWHNLANIESNWKDSRLDLAPLQSAYDVVAKRADAIRAAGDKAVADMETWKKAWETAAESNTRPVAPK